MNLETNPIFPKVLQRLKSPRIIDVAIHASYILAKRSMSHSLGGALSAVSDRLVRKAKAFVIGSSRNDHLSMFERLLMVITGI